MFYINKIIGVYSLCIQSTANKQLTVSFDFHDEKKDNQILSVRKKDFINIIYKRNFILIFYLLIVLKFVFLLWFLFYFYNIFGK